MGRLNYLHTFCSRHYCCICDEHDVSKVRLAWEHVQWNVGIMEREKKSERTCATQLVEKVHITHY